MGFDNNKLTVLKQQIERKAQLNDSLRSLEGKRYPLRNTVLKLESELEQAVNQEKELEKGCFSNILHRISGKLEEKREAAHKETNAAKRKYNTEAQKLNEIDDKIARIHEELKTIYYCDRDYNQAFDEKIAAIKASNHPDKNKFLDLENQIELLQSHITDIKGAITAGDSARASASRIVSLKESIYDVSVTDVLFQSRLTLLESAIDARDQHKETKKLKIKVYEQIDKFIERLVEISSFAKNYADISFFSKFIEWSHNLKQNDKNFEASIVIRQIRDMIKKLEIVVDIIESKRKITKTEYDNLVMQIRL